MGIFDIFEQMDGTNEQKKEGKITIYSSKSSEPESEEASMVEELVGEPKSKRTRKRKAKVELKETQAEEESAEEQAEEQSEEKTQEGTTQEELPTYGLSDSEIVGGVTKIINQETIPLEFLENPITNHAIVGRKRAVFEKYGEEAALYLGKVHEPGEEPKNIYFDSLDPQVIFICGSRGSGKCLVGETEIVLANGGIKQIKELKKDEELLALDNNLKIKKIKKENFYEREVKKILEITLNSGNSIKLTPEHPLYTINGWEQAKNIKKGTKIATPRVIPAFGKSKMEEFKVKLLAYLIAEGHMGNGFVLFSNEDKIILDDFKKAVTKFDKNLKVEVHSRDGCFRVVQKKKLADISELKRDLKGMFTKGSKIHIQKSSLIKYLDSVGLYGKKSSKREIPKEIFSLNKEKLALFLNRLFSCDGSIFYNGCWRLSYSSSSEMLIKQVHHLLLRFGIVNKIREKKVKYLGKYVKSFEIIIAGRFVADFIDRIGFFGKKANIAKIAKKELGKIKYNTNIDTIPKEIFSRIKVDNWAELGRNYGYKKPKSIINSKKYNISRDKLRKIGKILKNKELIALADSDIFWDEVIDIKEIKEKIKVYDITIPKYHNFIANNIFVHNSYSLGVIAEELAMKNPNVGMVVIDPVGVFWSMKYPNRQESEVKQLKEWGLEPKGLDNVFVFIPEGAKSKTPKETYDAVFTIQPSFLSAEDWALTFGIDRFSPLGLLLEKALTKVSNGYRTLDGLIVKGKKGNYDIDDIIDCLRNDSEINSKEKGYKKDTIRALISRFEASKSWGIFAKQGTPLMEISVPGQLTVIDVSFLDETVSALLVGVLARRILAARKIATRKQAVKKFSKNKQELDSLEMDIPPTWLFIDEAHTLIPSGSLETPASKAIIEYVKQGRRPGCSLVFATQQPSAIDTKVLSQIGTLISYKLVFDDDIKAVYRRIPTIVPNEFRKPGFIKRLEVGVPLFADRIETTSRAFVLKVRPRMSQHEGRETQTAEIEYDYSEGELLKIMSEVGMSKLDRYGSLDMHSLKTLLKILNMKYKSDIPFEKFLNALIEKGAKLEDDALYIEKEEELEEYREKVKYLVMEERYNKEQVEGIARRTVGWTNYVVNTVYRPLLKVDYKIYNPDGGFVTNQCYVDAVKVEFLHSTNSKFVYSQGLNDIKVFDADDLRLLLRLPQKKGFDLEYLEEISNFGEVKLKNMMERFISAGLIRKEKRGRRNVYFVLKNIEVPTNPRHKLLASVSDINFIEEEVEQEHILDPRITLESLRSLLCTIWKNIKIDSVGTILRKEYMFKNEANNQVVLFDSYYGHKLE